MEKEVLDLKFDIEICLGLTKDLITKVKKGNYTNDQWFLDFLDELNKLSIEY